MSLATAASAVLGVTSVATPPSPMFSGKLIQPGFVQHAGYQAALSDVIARNPQFKKHAFAVADLTVDPAKPKYAGYNDKMQVELGSLSKLMVLYAAHQVRFDLGWWWSNRVALGISDLAGLALMASDQYHRCGVPKGYPKVVSMMVRAAAGDAIYTPAEIEFQQQVDRGPPEAAVSRAFIQNVFDHNTPPAASLKAHEQLRLIGEWSDNAAPGRIARLLSLELIYECMRRSGLNRDDWSGVVVGRSDLKVAGGMYLGNRYGAKWVGAAKPKPPGAGSERTGTALSVATLMTALAQGRLIVPDAGDAEAHGSLLELLRRGNVVTDTTFIGDGIRRVWNTAIQPWAPNQPGWNYLPPLPTIASTDDVYASKIGLIPPGPAGVISDALLLRCKRLSGGVPKVVTVVIVGIMDWSKGHDDQGLLMKFGEEMARVIAAENTLDLP